ncbi:MAG: hypothetical protein D4R64_15710 [Porphyromonadaceae bacterium]|nr:MAG: hypothetical protein D4R64_15710 [Porphyromonadaceae bacterium]
MNIVNLVSLGLLLPMVALNVSGQVVTSTDNPRDLAIRVFMDCSSCDIDYIRREIPYVNYVRDPKECDVHILVTRQSTGSGGREYQIAMIGKNKFEGQDEKVVYTSSPDETSDLIRQGYTRIIALGLMKYVANTPLASHLNISYDLKDSAENSQNIVEDQWKSWVYNLDLQGDFTKQETYSSLQLESGVSATKITPEWKVDLNGNYYSFQRTYILEDTTILSHRNGATLSNLTVKSIGNHWSIGERSHISTDSYSNNRFSWSIYPAIEYDYFPYAESNRKQLIFQYRVGYGYNYYRDTTLYDKIEEGLFRHQLLIALQVRQPWGNIFGSLQGSQYLHDWSKNSLSFGAGIYLRILKGLSLTIEGQAALIHDQLSLPKAGATPEEVLLRQQQIASQYEFDLEFGLRYTFGSIYNNIVNPRMAGNE